MAAAFEHLLEVCRARDLACGGTVTPANAALRMEQGYRIFNFGGANGGLTETNAAARNAVIAAGRTALRPCQRGPSPRGRNELRVLGEACHMSG